MKTGDMTGSRVIKTEYKPIHIYSIGQQNAITHGLIMHKPVTK